ncbi:hypothetical protein AB0M43_08785 [Longispora sp. NPDC051575]|uniref:hypothetical protein n=1 Tax=Longispora sp. NPDC051575 TaxID=3154943 RepID=UPI00341E1381
MITTRFIVRAALAATAAAALGLGLGQAPASADWVGEMGPYATYAECDAEHDLYWNAITECAYRDRPGTDKDGWYYRFYVETR